MPYGISNSYKRGIMKTYSRRNGRVEKFAQASEPRIIYRMDATGRVKTETIGGFGAPSSVIASPDETEEEHEERVLEDARPVRTRTPPPKAAPSDDPPSSPLSPASNPFSADEEAELFSLPSSPPKRRRSSTPQIKARKPAFSYLNRKRKLGADDDADDRPLSEVNFNAVHTRKQHPGAKKQRLIQTTLDLGGEVSRTCKGCGMEYVPANAEDAALHKAFHAQNIAGVDLGKGFVKEAGVVQRLDDGETLVMVDSRSSATIRRRVRKVLDVVRTDLGAVEVEDERLWGVQEKKSKASKAGRGAKQPAPPPAPDAEKPLEAGKLFLHCVGDKCVGLCLAERIRAAAKVVPASASESRPACKPVTGQLVTKSSSILTEPSSAPMLLGISRIWTSKSHRRRGIATTLLDYARAHYFYGIEVPKNMVAFSQPTESGINLAQKWFDGARAGKDERQSDDGWHVYADGV